MGYQLEFRHLKYFLAVAEDLHFRKAAERLFISQPGLSRQIRQMEDDLGIKLFDRHNRKVVLTKAGEYLKEATERNLKELDYILDHAKLLHDGVGGNLRVGYVGSAMHEVIPNLLLQFKEKHPNIIFSLKEMDNQKQVKDLLSLDIDLGFVRLDRVPKDLEIRPVLEDVFCLVLPKNHPVSDDDFKDLSQFKNESFILFDASYSPSYYEKVMQIFGDSGFSPQVTHNTIHASSIYRLVENNLGLSIVPKSLQQGYNMGVKFIDLNKISQRAILSVIWNKENRNPVLKKTIELLT
ncbi:LysR family transcriptional regulator [Snuella lapsa]|uniref:LysR substrate-binding domain-containing protein n=1 Tax=Snuella lapsa TaxID=870481 RepID=A0ABP6WPB7_9FLAO